MAHATKTAIEKVEKKPAPESLFVTAEHFFEDFAKYTQEIGKRAFEIFNERGRQFGNELEDWIKAENEILKRVPIEMKEIDGKLEVCAEVPGFTAADLKVSVEPRRITLKGETERTEKEKLYTEMRSNRVFRTFDLPYRVDADKARAVIKNGVLTLTVPKLPPIEPREVEIRGE